MNPACSRRLGIRKSTGPSSERWHRQPGAAATLLAVLASLLIAFRTRKPRLRLRVYVSRMFGAGANPEHGFLTFSVVNAGERPVYLRGLGWRTGWLRRGPKFLRRLSAVQIMGAPMGLEPPFEIDAGQEVSSYAPLDQMIAFARERHTDPLFTRDLPFGLGRRAIRVQAYAYTADGHEVRVRPEKSLLDRLAEAEQDAVEGVPK